jgi:hypothetical protein
MATEGVAGSERCLAALLVVRVGFLGEELLDVVQTGAFRCSRTGSRTVFVRCSPVVRPLSVRCSLVVCPLSVRCSLVVRACLNGVRTVFVRCLYGARTVFGRC